MSSKTKTLRVAAGIGAAALLLGALSTGTPAQAVLTTQQTTATAAPKPYYAGDPTQHDGTLIWQETFDNGSNPDNVESYKTLGYSADAKWRTSANLCNGWITNAQSPVPTDTGCQNGGGQDSNSNPKSAWWFLTAMSMALGQQEQADGTAAVTAETNFAVASETNGAKVNPNTLDAGIQFTTDGGATFAPAAGTTPAKVNDFTSAKTGVVKVIPGHYYAVSVYFAAAHCFNVDPPKARQGTWTDAKEGFSLLEYSGSTVTAVPAVSGINPCTAPLASPEISVPATTIAGDDAGQQVVHVGQFASNAIQIPSGVDSVGLAIFNETNVTVGNDVAFDLPQIVDVTPQLDKSFSAAPATGAAPANVSGAIGTPATLTFTVTNTSDLMDKPGWSFTDTLADNLTYNGLDTSATTCGNGSVAPDGQALTISGDLTGATCDIVINVTPNGNGADVNAGAGQADKNQTVSALNGLLAPGSTELDVPALSIAKKASPAKVTGIGQTISYQFVVTATFGPVYNVAVTDEFTKGGSAGLSDIDCGQGTANVINELDPGADVTCTATYVTNKADVTAGEVDNTATANGASIQGGTSDLTASDIAAVPVAASNPSIHLDKTASPTTVTAANQVVTYTFVITNDGDVPLQDVALEDTDAIFDTDATTGAADASCDNGWVYDGMDNTIAATLAVGGVITCTATMTATADMVAAGGTVPNTATATGYDPLSGKTVSSDSSANVLMSAPVVLVSAGGSISPAMVLWPMLALIITGAAVWMINWRRKLAA